MAVIKNADMYSYLDQLSTQELESLLQKDAEDPDCGDLDMVMYIMEVIERREGRADRAAAADALKDFFLFMQHLKATGVACIPVTTQMTKKPKVIPLKCSISRDIASFLSAVRDLSRPCWFVYFHWRRVLSGGSVDFFKWLGDGHLKFLLLRTPMREIYRKTLERK